MVYFGWIFCFLLFLGLETAFGCLVSLWFAAGAFGGLVAAFLGGKIELQLGVFLAVSLLALLLVRPLWFFMGKTGKMGKAG